MTRSGSGAPAVSGFGGSSGSGATVGRGTTYQLAASTDWELDVWGRLRRTLENARAGAEASAADLANAKLTAQSQLAIAYLQLRGADAQRRLLSDTEVAYARTLTITQNRYAAGTAARTDVLQSQTQMYSAQDQEQAEILQRAQLENAIAALIGKPASGFTVAPLETWDIPVPQIPAGVPLSELLLRAVRMWDPPSARWPLRMPPSACRRPISSRPLPSPVPMASCPRPQAPSLTRSMSRTR